jgi:hypothetical protein
MKKQKWLFEKGCKYNSKISTVTEFLNWCQYGVNMKMLRDYTEE